MKRMRVYVSGVVQGVFFRAATRRAATDLNLTGWVRNMEDGRVEAVFEGANADLEKMITWCKVGPPAARVEKVTTMEEHYTGGFHDFSIKHLS
jgi:acylphosphatase